MPLPVSHSLAGTGIFLAGDRAPSARAWPRLALAVAIANAPDLDLIPGVLAGDPNRYHHLGTHSLITAVAVGAVAACLAAIARRYWPTSFGGARAALATGAIVAALWASHVVLDAVTHDPSPPHGVPMFWPVSDLRVVGPPLFWRADKVAGAASPAQFALSLLSWHNATAMAREVLLMLPLVALAWWSRRQLSGRTRPVAAARRRRS
jgi:inner membrane protein